MPTKLLIGKDTRSTVTFTRNPSDSGWNAVLTADTDTSISIPVDSRFVFFSFEKGSDVYSALDLVITLPTSASFVNDNYDLNTTGYSLEGSGASTIHFRSAASIKVNAVFYR